MAGFLILSFLLVVLASRSRTSLLLKSSTLEERKAAYKVSEAVLQ